MIDIQLLQTYMTSVFSLVFNIKQMLVPVEYIDTYFERESERITRLREEKLNTIL